jgi:hypothetical protein
MSRLIFADGRKYTSPPPAKNRKGMEALLGQAINRLRAGPPSPFQQLRELSERHAREDADIRAALRCVRAARRPAWLPLSSSSRGRARAPRRRVGTSRHCGRAPPGDDGGGGGSDPPAPPPQRDAPTPLAVLIARAEARALLWHFAELDLTTAVDELDAEAEVSGLLAAIGQDEVDAIIAAAFAAVCEPAVADGWTAAAADGWTAAAAEYHAASGKQTLIVEIEPERLARLRDLLPEDISLDHAVYELIEARRAAHAVATATLAAVEYLIQQNDAARLRQWLVQHSAQERAAILQKLEGGHRDAR